MSHNHDHRHTAHGEAKQFFLEDVLSNWRMRHVIKKIPAQSVVCDIGCGYRGRFLFRYAKKFAHAYGFDISVDTSLNSDSVTLRESDLNVHIPLEDNAVDVVTSLAVLEHLEQRQAHLQEIYRILKPGGKLLLTTPTPANKPLLEFLAFKLKVTDATEIADHKCYLTGKDLRTNLIEAGFTDEKIETKTWQLGLNNSVVAFK